MEARPPENEAESLRHEVARLREENEELRAHLGAGSLAAPKAGGEKERPVRVLLLPDPLREREKGDPGPKEVASVATFGSA